MIRLGLLGAAAASGLGCGGAPGGAPQRHAEDDRVPARPGASLGTPADSLVTTASGGTEIWLTLARPDSGPDGPCLDRAIEIRTGAMRLPVPLLYTTTAPQVLDDTLLRARLSDHCAPGDSYLVDLRTGHPVRERP